MFTLRRFKTSKANRSKRFKQLVVPIYFSSTKEIAIRQQRSKKRSPAPRAHTKAYRAVLQRQALIATILIVVGLSGAIYFGLQTRKVDKLEPSKTFSTSTPAPAKPIKSLPASEPTHISIPSVGIDASVMAVGKDANGGIEMPPLFDWTTGWYKYSPTPGQEGPSVIVGHVDTYKGISVFWRLRDIQPKDVIEITRADGRVVKFKVVALKQFEQSNFPTSEVYGNINHPGLRLITCGGAFNSQTESYTQNTVIFANMVTS